MSTYHKPSGIPICFIQKGSAMHGSQYFYCTVHAFTLALVYVSVVLVPVLICHCFLSGIGAKKNLVTNPRKYHTTNNLWAGVGLPLGVIGGALPGSRTTPGKKKG